HPPPIGPVAATKAFSFVPFGLVCLVRRRQRQRRRAGTGGAMADAAADRERDKGKDDRRRWAARCGFAVLGIMSTLLVYGVLQEKIMRVPYGADKEFFRYSLFLVFCNRITTSMVSAMVLLASKKSLDPVAPLHKYGVVSISNILTTTCQYEALKYVSFPVQTLAKCAKMIPVMIWGTIIMRKKYGGKDYFFAVIVTLGCALFILYPAMMDVSPFNKGRESTIWGVSLMFGYLGFDGFTSTFQDKLFKGYDMEIHNQIFYTTVCSCLLSLSGLILQNHLIPAVDFMFHHPDCFSDVLILSSVRLTSSSFNMHYCLLLVSKCVGSECKAKSLERRCRVSMTNRHQHQHSLLVPSKLR
ncbi:hypothetical protein Zm00014a_030936, partial [Zea mays]